MKSNKRILITGVAGFIGYHLATRLLKEGWQIFGIDNINDYYDVNLKLDRLKQLKKYQDDGSFHFSKMDISNRDSIDKLFADNAFNVVIHLAAQAGVRYSIEHPHTYMDANLVGFLNILEGARHNRIKSILYASSSSVYGSNTKLPFSEEDRVDTPISLYGATKKANELIAYTYAHLYSLQTIGLRFFTVYGPWGRPDMALFKFVKCISEQKPIEVYNFGKHSRSFTYVDDIVESIYRLVEKNRAYSEGEMRCTQDCYQIYNIGGDKAVQLMDYIKKIEAAVGKEAIIKYLPLQPGDVEKTEADTSLLEQETGFVPETEVDTGIQNVVDWYLGYYK